MTGYGNWSAGLSDDRDVWVPKGVIALAAASGGAVCAVLIGGMSMIFTGIVVGGVAMSLLDGETLFLGAIAASSYEKLSVATPLGHLQLAHILFVTAIAKALVSGRRGRHSILALPMGIALVPLLAVSVARPSVASDQTLVTYLLNAGLPVLATALYWRLPQSRAMRAFITGVAASSGIGIIEVVMSRAGHPLPLFNSAYSGSSPRAFGLAYEPAYLALAIALAAPMLVILRRQGTVSERYFRIVAVTLAIGAFATQARVLIVIAAAWWLWTLVGSLRRMAAPAFVRSVGVAMLVCILGIIAVGYVGTSNQIVSRVQSIGSTTDAASNAIRIRTYQATWAAVQNGHLLAGLGPGRMAEYVGSYGYPTETLGTASANGVAVVSPRDYTANNVALQALSDGGMLALMGAVIAAVVVARRLKRVDRSWMYPLIAVGVAGMLVSIGWDMKVWTFAALATMAGSRMDILAVRRIRERALA